MQVMNAANDKILLSTDGEPSCDQIEQCVLSHSPSLLAWTTAAGEIKLMSLHKNEVKTLGHHGARISLLKFSPSDILILTVASDGSIKVMVPLFQSFS